MALADKMPLKYKKTKAAKKKVVTLEKSKTASGRQGTGMTTLLKSLVNAKVEGQLIFRMEQAKKEIDL